MKLPGLIFCATFASAFLTAGSSAQHQMAVHKYPGGHLSISVPAGWVPIPKSELDQMSARLREAAPNSSPQPYNHGFQAPDGSGYPRVLVQVKTKGRWEEKVFEQLPQISSVQSDVQRRIESESPALAALRIQMNKLAYDPVRRMVWLRMQFTGSDGQTIQDISGLHPTEVGSIQVHCYALAADIEKYAPLFSEIITSVHVDDEWKYQERSAFARTIGSFGDLRSSALTGAIGGIVAVVALGWLRRRKGAAKTAHRVS